MGQLPPARCTRSPKPGPKWRETAATAPPRVHRASLPAKATRRGEWVVLKGRLACTTVIGGVTVPPSSLQRRWLSPYISPVRRAPLRHCRYAQVVGPTTTTAQALRVMTRVFGSPATRCRGQPRGSLAGDDNIVMGPGAARHRDAGLSPYQRWRTHRVNAAGTHENGLFFLYGQYRSNWWSSVNDVTSSENRRWPLQLCVRAVGWCNDVSCRWCIMARKL